MVRAAQRTVSTGTLWIWEWGRLLTTCPVPASVDSILGQLCVCVCVCAQLCPTLCDPTDCSLPGFSVHGMFQARILEWVATSFSWGSS